MSNDKCSNSYEERNSIETNVAEDRFIKWCELNKLEVHRFGFDEKKDKVSIFYKLHPIIRSFPDYLVVYKGVPLFFHVKGTNKIKLSDIEHYTAFRDMFCVNNAGVFIAFCFSDSTKMVNLNKIIEFQKTAEVKEFENDHKQYIEYPA